MYFMNRAFKYLKKKVGKTILLAIIFLVIANFVLAGLLVRNASVQAQKNTRQTLGANVTYGINLEKVFEDYQKGKLDYDGTVNLKMAFQKGILISQSFSENGIPTYENLMKIVDSDYVKDYTISVVTAANCNDLLNYSVDAASSDDFEINAFVNQTPANFKEGYSTLIEGRSATYDEILNGEKVVLIDKEIADLNNLDLGDNITISADLIGDGVEEASFEIVGIFESESTTDMRATSYENKIYVPLLSLQNLGITTEEIDYMLVNPVIELKDPMNTDLYREEALDLLGFDMRYGMLDANDDLYNSMIGPIESLGDIANVLVMIIAITGAVIIGLITALTVNERKGEIGILLAVGERKFKIVSQFVMEVLVIAIIAFALSTITGGYLGDKISDYALDSEILSSQSNEMSINRMIPARAIQNTKNMQGGNTAAMANAIAKNQELKEELEKESELDISLGFTDLMELFLIGILLASISTAIPSLYVMRFNPKQILTNKDS